MVVRQLVPADASNFVTPSSSSTLDHFVEEMPSASIAAIVAAASSPVPVTVSAWTTPWSANASSVFSGMVLTVPATTSSSTYIVSR